MLSIRWRGRKKYLDMTHKFFIWILSFTDWWLQPIISYNHRIIFLATMNYPKKTGFNLYQMRHCAYITYNHQLKQDKNNIGYSALLIKPARMWFLATLRLSSVSIRHFWKLDYHRAVSASSQCYRDELMLLKWELMLLKWQINTNTNKNGFLLPTKCLERVLKLILKFQFFKICFI